MAKQQQGPILPFVRIDLAASMPKFRQIQDQLRTAILQGHLRAGSRLPASRVLADELAMSRPTIVRVLENLKSEGYLETRQGSGTFVAGDLPRQLPRQGRPRGAATQTETAAPRLSRIGDLSRLMAADLGKAEYRPFLPNHPAFERFPFAIWRKCLNIATSGGRANGMGYGDPAGEAVLRQRIAEYLALHRGDLCDHEQIVITPGGHNAFALAALALGNPGDRIWLEDPGPLTVCNLFRTLALNVCPVAVDRDGMDVGQAIKKYPDARFAFAMPSRHHPLGVTLSLPRRLAMLDWARQHEAWIIEDDYDSEFRYVGPPLPSIRSVDGHDRVIYVGTFSKALYPAIRVGYLVLPPRLVGTFRNLAGLMNRSVPVDVQLALAEFIGGGHFATHLRRMRDLYTERRAAFMEIGAGALDGLARIDCPDSGMNAIAWLESGRDDVAVHRSAVAAGIQCFPLSDYTVGAKMPGALILGFSGVPVERMKRHFNTLADAIARS
ncbi:MULTISPECIES: PLP-dependent aminotransferase family protein [unclassified Mesorhizobium]|uniref:MocR-like pyridoxine biosynthesis transcription factor PdxR n=1 Tax=unclassified Mesorhizobium TaxID=325217 RepID=UPI00167BF637|nr:MULTISPECIES: PLP-dependent aminotransferase family protein [unclassified Mesorhizobium]